LPSGDELRVLVTRVREKLGDVASVVALAAEVADKPLVTVAVSAAARDLGHNSGVLAKTVAGILGGGGGGKPELAQGGGTDITAIPAALDAVRHEVAAHQGSNR